MLARPSIEHRKDCFTIYREEPVLYGSALALTATLQTWAHNTGTSVLELTRTAVR